MGDQQLEDGDAGMGDQQLEDGDGDGDVEPVGIFSSPAFMSPNVMHSQLLVPNSSTTWITENEQLALCSSALKEGWSLLSNSWLRCHPPLLKTKQSQRRGKVEGGGKAQSRIPGSGCACGL